MQPFLPRRKFVSQVGLGLSDSIYVLIYGITIGRYNYKVKQQRIFFPVTEMPLTVLPLQISDVTAVV
jgi:hypothetical protein